MARLVLTSSEAELLGGQLHDMMGYTELTDAVETTADNGHSAVQSKQQAWTPDTLATLKLHPPKTSRSKGRAV